MFVSRRTTNILLILILAVGIGIVAMLATVARGGPLDPEGSPASTMKTLDEIPGSWTRSLPADDGLPDGEYKGCQSTRFECVLNNQEAVLDRETGLVWERNISSAGVSVWHGSQCTYTTIGGVQGWRLPTIAELNSLVDDTGTPPYVPAGHPFTNVHPTDPYWTSTPFDGNGARTMSFDGGAGAQDYATGTARAWCVRGPE